MSTNKINQNPEFGGEDVEQKGEEPEKIETEEKGELEEEKGEPTVDNKTPDPVENEKFYEFNGRQLTPDELYNEARLLQAEFTRRTQVKPELPLNKETPPPVEAPVDPEQIKAFKEFGKKAGIVFVEDIEKQKENDIWSNFIKDHPEYVTDPLRQRALAVELQRYNNKPEFLERNLKAAHNELNPAGDAIVEARVRAATERAKRASHPVAVSTPTITPDQDLSKHNPRAVEIAKKFGLL